MKRIFSQICAASVILAVLMTGCGPSEKEIAEKKQLEAKVAELENKLQEISIAENTKKAIEAFLKKEMPPTGIVKCLSVTLNKGNGQNEWLATGEVVCVVPGMPVDFVGLTDIRVAYNPENKSVKADFSGAKNRKSPERLEKECISNLKQFGIALLYYASDHDGRFPDAKDFSDFIKGNANSKSFISCPVAENLYFYIPGLREGSNPKLTLVYCKHHNKNGECLQLHADGSVGYGKILKLRTVKK